MKKLIIAFMVIIVIAAVFAGCSNDRDNDQNPDYTVVPTVTASITVMPDGQDDPTTTNGMPDNTSEMPQMSPTMDATATP